MDRKRRRKKITVVVSFIIIVIVFLIASFGTWYILVEYSLPEKVKEKLVRLDGNLHSIVWASKSTIWMYDVNLHETKTIFTTGENLYWVSVYDENISWVDLGNEKHSGHSGPWNYSFFIYNRINGSIIKYNYTGFLTAYHLINDMFVIATSVPSTTPIALKLSTFEPITKYERPIVSYAVEYDIDQNDVFYLGDEGQLYIQSMFNYSYKHLKMNATIEWVEHANNVYGISYNGNYATYATLVNASFPTTYTLMLINLTDMSTIKIGEGFDIRASIIANKIVWHDRKSQLIHISELDGSELASLNGTGRFFDLGNRFAWASYTDELDSLRIFSANMDGTDIRQLI